MFKIYPNSIDKFYKGYKTKNQLNLVYIDIIQSNERSLNEEKEHCSTPIKIGNDTENKPI